MRFLVTGGAGHVGSTLVPMLLKQGHVGREGMNLTKDEVARKILEQVNHDLHFAEFGRDAGERNNEVPSQRIRKQGFETIIDLDRGSARLVRTAQLISLQNPFANV